MSELQNQYLLSPIPVRRHHPLLEAVFILQKRFFLLSAIILTVWLPGNALAGYLSRHVFEQSELIRPIRVNMWIEGIFGPVYIGAMVYALSRIKQGLPVRYKEAMSVGLKNWRRLFAAQFMAGLFIILGLLALIVPGILLVVRYALVSPIVILEEVDPSRARERSAFLTQGRRWQIFWTATVFLLCYLLAGLVLYLPQMIADSLDVMGYDLVVDCLLDLLFGILQIAMFLYYWQARAEELGSAALLAAP